MPDLPWPADKVERWPLDRLKPYAKNARTHSPEQIEQLKASICEFGFTVPVLADERGRLIAGHARATAAKALGLTDIPVMVAAGWTEDQKRAYTVADNQLVLRGGWDLDLLRGEVGELSLAGFNMDLLGFGGLELTDLLTPRAVGLTDPDDAPEPPAHPVSQRGDIWRLGRHVLVCGDATSEVDVSLCLGGVRPHLMVTDPPYGVHLDHTWRDRSGANTKGRAEANSRFYLDGGAADTEARWDAAWVLSPADVFYVFCAAGPLLIEAAAGLADSGFELRQILVWDKGVLTLTRTHYWYTHEHILYGVRKGKSAHWVGTNAQPSVWHIPSPKHIMSGSTEKREPHPAQRPVECMKRPIENNSNPGQAIYEPFSGSGTTIIAAEMTGRACHAIEISEQYVDVAIQRWEAFTGQQATLAATGQTYAEVAAERIPQLQLAG